MIQNEGENVPEGKRRKNYVQGTTVRWVGGGGTSNYAKTFEATSAFVLMVYNDVTSTTQL
jgi:hypothetical protein